MAQEQVNVHTHAINARKRTNGSEPLGPADDDSPEDSPFWERIKKLFPSPEVLNVAGRVIEKGLVLTPAMGLTIFLAFGSVVGAMYLRMDGAMKSQSETINKQNELLIRLDQRFIDKERHDLEYRQEVKDTLAEHMAWQQVTNKDLARLLGPRK